MFMEPAHLHSQYRTKSQVDPKSSLCINNMAVDFADTRRHQINYASPVFVTGGIHTLYKSDVFYTVHEFFIFILKSPIHSIGWIQQPDSKLIIERNAKGQFKTKKHLAWSLAFQMSCCF